MNKLKKIIKGLLDSVKFKTSNPFRFHLSAIKELDSVSDDYLIVKLKHEAHLLEKNIKNHYKENHGKIRRDYVRKLISECENRSLREDEIINWSKRVVSQYGVWESKKKPVVTLGGEFLTAGHPLSVPSVRFWDERKPSKELIIDCVKAAQLAPASCNRQAFKVIVLENKQPKTKGSSALNSSMFDATAYRVFIYYNRNNYTEKYSAAIDVGMFSQNFILEAKKNGLGCCCCYASEHLEKSQKEYLNKFNLGNEYYCLLSILVGYPNEVVSKPPRVSAEKLIKFYTR